MHTGILCVGVFACGVGAGVFGSREYFKQKYEKIAEDEIADVKRNAKKRIRQAEDEKDRLAGLVNVSEVKDEETKQPKRDVPEKKITENSPFVDYSSYSGPITTSAYVTKDELSKIAEDSGDPDFQEHLAEREHPEDDEPQIWPFIGENPDYEQMVLADFADLRREDIRPYPITRAEFGNQRQWYEKLTYTYYDDDVLTDDNDQPFGIEDQEEYFPEGLEDLFDRDPMEPDIVYMRYPKQGIDYEVVRVAEAYSDKHPVEDGSEDAENGAAAKDDSVMHLSSEE